MSTTPTPKKNAYIVSRQRLDQLLADLGQLQAALNLASSDEVNRNRVRGGVGPAVAAAAS